MLVCEFTSSLALYELDQAYRMKRVLGIADAERSDAQLLTYDDTMSVIFFTKSYDVELLQQPL